MFTIWICYIQSINYIQGTDPNGIVAYINQEGLEKPHYINGHFTGLQWQCVEYARRWLIVMKNVTFKSVYSADDIWNLKYVHSITTNDKYKFINHPIWSKKGNNKPPIGSLLIYKKTKDYPYGHVAVVVGHAKKSFVYVAEQNESILKWTNSYSRKININTEKNLYGWKIII